MLSDEFINGLTYRVDTFGVSVKVHVITKLIHLYGGLCARPLSGDNGVLQHDSEFLHKAQGPNAPKFCLGSSFVQHFPSPHSTWHIHHNML